MTSLSTSAVPENRYEGELGPELVVLSTSVVRVAQQLERPIAVETADGTVKGGEGDFVITVAGGERYPIIPEVFFGTYQVIGQVGERFIGRRLVHVRRAWTIESAAAPFRL